MIMRKEQLLMIQSLIVYTDQTSCPGQILMEEAETMSSF